MKISQKGLYALEALMHLANRCDKGLIKIQDIADSEGLPKKFLELILLDLKLARIVESGRGVNGGYRLKRAPSEIFLGDVIRTIDGPLAPFGDAQSLRENVRRDERHGELFRVFLSVRNAAAEILDHTSLADICREQSKHQVSESDISTDNQSASGAPK